MDLSIDDKIDLIVNVCHKCADKLKDPTEGKSDMTAESRNNVREEAYDDLLVAVDALAACMLFHSGFFDVVNIASKIKLNGGSISAAK